MVKEVGIIGLGRMGSGMALRAKQNGIRVVGYNRSRDVVDKIKKKGVVPAYSVEELVSKLKSKKRVVWIMLPTGKITDDMIKEVLPLLKKRDVIVNGANSFYKNAERQERVCRKFEVVFL